MFSPGSVSTKSASLRKFRSTWWARSRAARMDATRVVARSTPIASGKTKPGPKRYDSDEDASHLLFRALRALGPDPGLAVPARDRQFRPRREPADGRPDDAPVVDTRDDFRITG